MSDTGTPPEIGDGDAGETPVPAREQSTDSTDWKAEAEKWAALSRKTEQDAKKARSELSKLQAAHMTEQEKAVAEAEAKGRDAALAELSGRLVEAEIRAATADREVDVDALLEGLDPRRFISDSGEPDREAIEKFLDRIAPKQAKRLDLGQGVRPDAATTNSDMNAMLRRAAGR